MEDDLHIKAGLTIPGAELEVSSSRSSGPGGQHANKTNSRISLRWNVASSGALSGFQRNRLLEKLGHRLTTDGVLQVDAEESRSQHQNREVARERLAELVRKSLAVQKKRRATRPSRASKERRLGKKKKRSQIKASRRRPPDD